MSEATFAHGSTLKLGSDTTLTELTAINGVDMSADAIEVTNHDSPDRYREFIQGLRDGGEIAIEGNFTTSTSTELYTQFNTTSLVSCTITLPTKPSNSQWVANVFATGLGTSAPIDDKIPFTSTLKITGKPVLSQV